MINPRGFQKALKETVTDPIQAGTLTGDAAGERLDRAEQAFREMIEQLIEFHRPKDDDASS
jgi:hypothetical protein